MNFLTPWKSLWSQKESQKDSSIKGSPATADLSDEESEKLEILKKSLPLFEKPVCEIMTPRADIDWVDLDQDFSKVHKYVLRSSHNYFPVGQHDLDKLIGRISLKKILLSEEDTKTIKLEKYIEPVLFVSPSLSCVDLIIKMKKMKNHMAVVVDEFGGVDGLVTLNDISQEVIGEIDSDQSSEISPLLVHKDGTVTVDGRMPLENIEQEIPGLVLQDKSDGAETIGGLVSSLAGHIPARGELIKHGSGLTFEVLVCDARRIKKLRLHNVVEAKKE